MNRENCGGDAGSGNTALYIHVPFCRQRCAYCHFDIKVFHPRSAPRPFYDRYLRALMTEVDHYAAMFPGRTISSVYYGGGTPSRLPRSHLVALHRAVCEGFQIGANAEVSMEVNPEDASPALFAHLLELGFTRVSMGVQTFHDPSLAAVNRAHDRATALAALKRAPRFSHGVSLDLMLGLPYQTPATLAADLDLIAELAPEHLSVYMLERDLPTPLDKTTARTPLPSEDDQADFYETVCARLARLGYRQYEISNFAKPGYPCRHNLNYWRMGNYLGLGPAAHGRMGEEYYANARQLTPYLLQVKAHGRGRENTDVWSAKRFRQERLVQGMRLAEGVPTAWIGAEELAALRDLSRAGLVRFVGDRVALTARGRLLANEVFAVF